LASVIDAATVRGPDRRRADTGAGVVALDARQRARRGRSNRKPRTPAPARSAPAPAPAPGDRSFWNAGPKLADLRISPLAGEAPEALVRRLGPAPIAAGGLDLADALADMYAQLAATAERRALAE